MLAQIVLLITGTVFGFITLTLLARFFMQWGRVSFRNPVGHFVITVTDWAVMPTRRIIPGLFGLDMASLLLAWVAQILNVLIEIGLGIPVIAPVVIPLLGLVDLARMAVYLIFGVVLVAVLLSWVGPQAPAAYVFNELSRPFLAPFRRLIRPLGGIDLSPLVLLLALQIVLLVIAQLRRNLLMLPSVF
ncbi:MAG: YggT family protein [Proteobacteria bacterium]|jgi:YggT family protein|nr:YggT family protein [Pseudomonadota bacterium]